MHYGLYLSQGKLYSCTVRDLSCGHVLIACNPRLAELQPPSLLELCCRNVQYQHWTVAMQHLPCGLYSHFDDGPLQDLSRGHVQPTWRRRLHILPSREISAQCRTRCVHCCPNRQLRCHHGRHLVHPLPYRTISVQSRLHQLSALRAGVLHRHAGKVAVHPLC